MIAVYVEWSGQKITIEYSHSNHNLASLSTINSLITFWLANLRGSVWRVFVPGGDRKGNLEVQIPVWLLIKVKWLMLFPGTSDAAVVIVDVPLRVVWRLLAQRPITLVLMMINS